MPIRYYAQRKHIIFSLDSLLYQLHTLSFILAPSILAYFFRCATQFQFARARDLDGSRSLGFWFFIIAFVNLGSVWTHAAVGVPEGKTIVLDFVGMGRRPSKTQLLLLDFTIMFLQALLTSISYETSLTLVMPEDETDPLAPLPSPTSEENSQLLDFRSIRRELQHSYPPSPSPSPSPIPTPPVGPFFASPTKEHLSLPPLEPVIVVTFQHIFHRLRSPVPVPPERTRSSIEELLSLPLPNTTSTRRLHQTLRLLAQTRPLRMGAEAARRNTARAARSTQSRNDDTSELGTSRREETQNNDSSEPQASRPPSSGSRIPGAIDSYGLE